MEQKDRLAELGLFDQRVPRYTSYPTAPVFDAQVRPGFQADCLAGIDPAEPVSVYVHIPFCERLCWFCACRTQGTSSLRPVEAYLETLKAELSLLRRRLPEGASMAQLHWGGGTPTILLPEQITTLAEALRQTFDVADPFEFSVEIDPTLVDGAKIAALQGAGMTRASIGIQDFLPEVQDAIGRQQSYEQTRECVEHLRNAGIQSLNADLVYGLPHQTIDTLQATIKKVLTLDPDRVALFGYAHVPWMSKRQKLIDESALPDDGLRYALACRAAEMFVEAGYVRIGIDHFAKPKDKLAFAARSGHLRRNFQGYTDDTCETLVGVGASSMSKYPAGYVQNAAATAAYTQRIEAGMLAGARGYQFGGDDKLRARVIEMIMCDFAVDTDVLEAEFGPVARVLEPLHRDVTRAFAPFVARRGHGIEILTEGRPLTRIIASRYDAYADGKAMFSKAS